MRSPRVRKANEEDNQQFTIDPTAVANLIATGTVSAVASVAVTRLLNNAN